MNYSNDSSSDDSTHPKSYFLRVTALLIGILLLLSAGMAKVKATSVEGGDSDFVLDSMDEELGIATGHYASHDILLGVHSGVGGTTSEVAHWSFVATSPTDAPVVTTVKYFLHNGAGLHPAPALVMTAAQIADIATAAGIWNGSGANVELVPALTDATADIHVHMDATSGCGPGAIGCAEFSYFLAHNPAGYGAGTGHPVPGDPGPHPQHMMASQMVVGATQEMTMYSHTGIPPGPGAVIPWYSGAPGLIPAASFDFLTVAIQEFGHHLGLGHNDFLHGHPADIALSPMNGILPFGNDSRRILQPSDTAAIIHLYGAIPEPSSIVLALMAFGGLIAYGFRKRCAR